MSYARAMEVAGAEILAFRQFGDYQGTWWAKVRYKGEVGWATGYYGSCSGCDAFEGEFGWSGGHDHPNNEYVSMYSWPGNAGDTLTPESCDVCKDLIERLADFGKRYVEDTLLTQAEAEADATKKDWDSEVWNILAFLQEHR